MLIKLFRRFILRRKTQYESVQVSQNVLPEKAKHSVPAAARKSEWEEVLTQSLKENALAPSDEVILHAFDFYCDDFNAPFVKRRRAMNERFSNVIAEFAALQALAPDMIERAAAKHRLELDRFLEKKGRKS